MLATLRDRGLAAGGVPAESMTVYHLVGRDTASPDHPHCVPFSLQFAMLSPYAAAEILNLTDAQQVRFMKAYDIAKEVLRDLEIFPQKGHEDQERLAMEIDEFERGYPRLTLTIMMDIVAACLKVADLPKREGKSKDGEATAAFSPRDQRLATPRGLEALKRRIYGGHRPEHAVSWGAL